MKWPSSQLAFARGKHFVKDLAIFSILPRLLPSGKQGWRPPAALFAQQAQHGLLSE